MRASAACRDVIRPTFKMLIKINSLCDQCHCWLAYNGQSILLAVLMYDTYIDNRPTLYVPPKTFSGKREEINDGSLQVDR